MMVDVYEGSFSSWEDVCREFEESIPEPDEVIFAVYDQEMYEGSADVVYRVGERFYWVSGSHCSCYGLEEQFDPEEYSAELLIAALRRGRHFYWAGDRADVLREEIIERVISSASYHCGYWG